MACGVRRLLSASDFDAKQWKTAHDLIKYFQLAFNRDVWAQNESDRETAVYGAPCQSYQHIFALPSSLSKTLLSGFLPFLIGSRRRRRTLRGQRV